MQFKFSRESIELLFKGSKSAVPFNIILSTLLSLDLIYNNTPVLPVVFWCLTIILISLIRFFFSKQIIKKRLNKVKKQFLIQFFILTLAMGVAWGSIYFIILFPPLTVLHELLIILVLGGLCAGSIASLSIYLPAFYAFILSMFLPIIIYNFLLFNFNRTILATMFILFVGMLIVSARINNKLLNTTLKLSREKESLIHKLQTLSITDPLTGLYNRRNFQILLPKEIARAKRNRYPISLVSIDVDNFKLINDNFGHPDGDTFLINIGGLLNRACQGSNDSIFRLGGDEFAVILANQTLAETVSVCHSIHEQFKKYVLEDESNLVKQSVLQKVTLSMGLVHIHFKYPASIETLISIADKALYQAKKKGKNQIVIEDLH